MLTSSWPLAPATRERPRARVAGTGFVTLDVLLGADDKVVYSGIGGSAGNVLSILAYFGWDTVPLVNLGRDRVGAAIHREFSRLGADVSHVRLDRGLTSPLLYQFAGSSNAAPRYSFSCPVCGKARKFREELVDSGGEDFARCAASSNVFFFDRVTAGTVRMAQAARGAGSLVFFEPSARSGNADLFAAALRASHVVKYSSDRIDRSFDDVLHWGFIEIQTCGARGLRFRRHSLAPDWVDLTALQAEHVADTSGAGDWCTAGFLHALLSGSDGAGLQELSYNEIYSALRAGQFIAALSVSHLGARGLMRACPSPDSLSVASQGMHGSSEPQGMQLPRTPASVGSVCCEALSTYVRPRAAQSALSS